jgi:multidrug efflux system membrane fusion protein
MKDIYQRSLSFIKQHKKISGGVAILLIAFIYWQFFSHKTRAVEIPLVTAAKVEIRPMPIDLKAVGSVESQQSVTITPQVTGIITKINFQPGAHVTAGQVLFEIESDTFNATLEQAEATLQRDQAQLVYLEADAKRYASLVKLEYVTRDQYEQAKASADAQDALVKADQAQVDQAKIQLGHTIITAPVSGKAGNYTVRVGDLVVADNSALVTINQLNPLWIDFNVPQNQLVEIRQYQHQQPLKITIFSEDEKQKLGHGKLTFIDNNVNAQTGTVLLKAEVDNSNDVLWPGQMVSVVITLKTIQNALVIPLRAVQFDDDGSFVYTLKDNKAVIQAVTITKQTENLAVVSKGLTINDQVLTTIPPDLEDGTVVKLVDKVTLSP